MGKLDDYIEEQLATGYSAQQLSAFLLTQNYSQKELDTAFSRIREKHERQRIQNYIYDRERQGVSPKNIKQELFQQKFTPNYIQEELRMISGGRRHVLSFLVLLAIAVSIILTAMLLIDFSSDSSSSSSETLPVEFVSKPTPVVEDVADCASLSGSELAYCVRQLSLEKADPALCSLSGTPSAHDDCLFTHLHKGIFVACDDFLQYENAYLCEHQQDRAN